MAERDFPLTVLTPTSTVFEGEVRSLRAPGGDGDFEVLVGHIPFLTALRPGLMRIVHQGATTLYAVSGGVVEVLRHQTTVLADAVERADQIDVERARQAEARARQRLETHDAGIDRKRAQAALARAVNRLQAAELGAE